MDQCWKVLRIACSCSWIFLFYVKYNSWWNIAGDECFLVSRIITRFLDLEFQEIIQEPRIYGNICAAGSKNLVIIPGTRKHSLPAIFHHELHLTQNFFMSFWLVSTFYNNTNVYSSKLFYCLNLKISITTELGLSSPFQRSII